MALFNKHKLNYDSRYGVDRIFHKVCHFSHKISLFTIKFAKGFGLLKSFVFYSPTKKPPFF